MIKNPQFVSCSAATLPRRVGHYIIPDLQYIWNGLGTHSENVIEFAGRVCYRSTDKMGNSPDFILARLREGHEDIIEHGWISIDAEIVDPLKFYKTCKYLIADELPGGRHLISGNYRAWKMYFSRDNDTLAELALAAPQIFNRDALPFADVGLPPVELRQIGQSKVAMLLAHAPDSSSVTPRENPDHYAATFLIDGISRTCSHQIVRHRLGSFGQESQRYVDLRKGEWNAVVPPAIDEHPEGRLVMAEAWTAAEAAYVKLRELGIRKEDARFLLPNAAETRLVMTMSLAGWKHFLHLRLDKAAQWEVRNVAAMINEMLRELFLF